jgi:hypothetical protein
MKRTPPHVEAQVAKLLPWTFSTAPKGYAIYRMESEHENWLVPLRWTCVGLYFINDSFFTWANLAKGFSYSTDGGASWLSCGTYEEGQP